MAPPGGTRAGQMHGPGAGRAGSKGRMSTSPAGALFAARHDLEVLQGAARSLASGCLPGSCRAVTHGGRLCGQLHQALAEPTEAQLLCRPREKREAVLGRKAAPGRGCPCHHHALPNPYSHPYLLWSSPTIPRPPSSHTNIQVADVEGLLLRELAEDTAASRAQSAQGARGAAAQGQDLLSHRIPQRIPGAAWAPVPKSI